MTLPAGGRHHSQPRGDFFTPGRGVAAPAKVAPASAATPRPGVTPHPGVVSTPARCAETNFPAGINLGQWCPPSQRSQCTLLAESLVKIPVVTAMPPPPPAADVICEQPLRRSDCETSVKNTSHSWQSPICLPAKMSQSAFKNFHRDLGPVPQTYLILYIIINTRSARTSWNIFVLRNNIELQI